MLTALARFGTGHLAILAASVLAIAAAASAGRRLRGRPAAAPLARCLAYPILAALLANVLVHRANGELTLAQALPLQLCDAAAAACVLALWTRRPVPFELSYFWGLAGVTQALLTPPPGPGLDDPDAWRYVTLHAATLAGLAFLLGMGQRPRRGAWARVSLLTIAYAVAVGLIDWALGANYMWLAEKPRGSVLELFGPWPFYILGGAVVGALLFYLLELPCRKRRGAGEDAPGAP